jgi:phosphatidylinositol alpha-1,6-mannosyltransferase
VLAVARLETADAYKGIDTLVYSWLEVASRVPGARLVVVGEGSDRRRLETSARLLGLDGKVMFTGRLTDSELADAYRSAAIFALPSQTRFDPRPEGEGFGLVFIEAGAAGLPVVAGRSGAVSEVVDEESGILVDAESPREVAAAITALLQDRDLARRLGRGGRRKAQTEFSYPAFKERISSLMDEIELAHRSGVA